MTDFTQSLLPTAAERVSRVCTDLRLNLPSIVSDDGTSAVIVAIESLSQDRLDALRGLFGAPELILTANRARAVMAPTQAKDVIADPVRIQPPIHADIAWFQRLADTAFDSKAGPVGPLHLLRKGDVGLQNFALTLAKTAQLLPAVLMFPLAADAVLPAPLNMAQLDLHDAASHFAADPGLYPVAAAALPLKSHEQSKLHVFRDADGITEHYALEIGTPDLSGPVLSRLHSACFTGDVLGSLKCDCGPQLHAAMAQMGAEGAGILLYLNQEGRGIGLANKMRVYDLQSEGFDTVEANHRLGFADDERDFRLAAVMLRSLGVKSVRLLTNNPAKVDTFRAQGVVVDEQLPLRVGKNIHNQNYLAVKALKSGHAL